MVMNPRFDYMSKVENHPKAAGKFKLQDMQLGLSAV